MYIVIAGARERDTDEDRDYVNFLIEQIQQEAPHTIFVGTLTHTGVGRYVREKCLERDGEGRYRFALIECSVKIFAQGLAKSDLATIYLARNATPFEMADALIYLASEDRRGTVEELKTRFDKAGRPVLVLAPGQAVPGNIMDCFVRLCAGALRGHRARITAGGKHSKGAVMSYHSLSDSGMSADEMRQEADRILDVFRDTGVIRELEGKDRVFVDKMAQGFPVTTGQLFFLRDLKTKYCE